MFHLVQKKYIKSIIRGFKEIIESEEITASLETARF